MVPLIIRNRFSHPERFFLIRRENLYEQDSPADLRPPLSGPRFLGLVVDRGTRSLTSFCLQGAREPDKTGTADKCNASPQREGSTLYYLRCKRL